MRYERGELRPTARGVVQEFPLRLRVNGRDLATLVASPHRLAELAAGFLRLQGFIDHRDQIVSMGVCADFGLADLRIKGEIPEKLTPTLTSGCGTGITFNLPGGAENPKIGDMDRIFPPEAVFALMRELTRRAENYASHGGIHSAAIGDGEALLLFAEDLGRHNTLDRLAGQALLRNLDLQGKMIVTSGRVSTEMVAKAARLGIALIASRTSPTDQAVEMARAAGITLIGYLRGEHFDVYSHPERLAVVAAGEKIPGVTGVILAGGESRRMGSDKALLPFRGARFIDHIYRCLDSLFDEVVIVTNSPGLFHDIPCRKVPDIYYGKGSLAGIHSGLCHARTEKALVVACDMPFVHPEAIRRICLYGDQAQVVIPRRAHGLEPLHALYDKSCLPIMEEALDAGERRIVSFFPQVSVQEVAEAELCMIDRQGLSFRNINTPQEYFTLRDGGREDRPAVEDRVKNSRQQG